MPEYKKENIKNDTLLCTYKGCTEPQGEDSEFCNGHGYMHECELCQQTKDEIMPEGICRLCVEESSKQAFLTMEGLCDNCKDKSINECQLLHGSDVCDNLNCNHELIK